MNTNFEMYMDFFEQQLQYKGAFCMVLTASLSGT
jgi:hypothetical protein